MDICCVRDKKCILFLEYSVFSFFSPAKTTVMEWEKKVLSKSKKR